MTDPGPVGDWEMSRLREEYGPRGWVLTWGSGGRITASRESPQAQVTARSAAQMRVILHDEMWKSLTGTGSG